MRPITIIIPIALLLSCSEQKKTTKANAEPPSFEVKTGTAAGVKLNVTKKAAPDAVKDTHPIDVDYNGYYLPWPRFPIHPSAVKDRSNATPNLHYGSFHIHTVDHKTKTISFSNLAFGKRTEYNATFKIEFPKEGSEKPVLIAKTKQFSFHVYEKRILYWDDQGMTRMNKLKPFKYNPSLQPKLPSPTSDKQKLKFSSKSLPNASTDILKAENIKNLTIADLKIMRKSIYARHGAAFEDHKFAKLFSKTVWYVPLFTLDEAQEKLTKIEIKNIDLIFLKENEKR